MHSAISHTVERRSTQDNGNHHRTEFVVAVRSYAGASVKDARIRSLEQIVHCSREIRDDDGVMPEDVRRALVALYGHYTATDGLDAPVSFRDARDLVQALLF